LSCLSTDTDNVFVCLSARDPDLTIVARSLEEGIWKSPTADIRLDIGDEMIVVGHPDQVAKYGTSPKP